MASISQISGDWTHIASESKRKSSVVFSAVEKAQQTAKSCDIHAPISQMPEKQLLFTAPFILALESGNDKLMTASLLPISRLAGSKTLTDAQIETLLTVLSSLDLAAQSMETQLKILQVLVQVMQNFGANRKKFLQIVELLAHLTNSSAGGVANAASATLQQIFSSLYDQLKNHVKNSDASEYALVLVLNDEKHEPLALDDLEYTCHYTFLDLCSVVSGGDLELFQNVSISKPAALENIESIITYHSDAFYTHQDLAHLLRQKAVPAILNTLNGTSVSEYPLFVRALRLVHLLVSRQLPNVEIEAEIVLLFTNHIVLNSSPHSSVSTGINLQNLIYPHWGQVLVIEMYKMLFSNFTSIKSLFEAYDNVSQKKKVLNEVFSVLRTYLSNNFSSMISKEGLVVPRESSVSFMTKGNSQMQVTLIDHLEKKEPTANIPDFYLPRLILGILIEASNGVAEFVVGMSLNVASETLEGEVEFITLFIECLFPEMIQLFDMFLHFTMDTELFIDLVASLQRYTHAAGLLGLCDFRDKLLILLAKCVSISSVSKNDKPRTSSTSNIFSIGETIVESISSTISSPGSTNEGVFGEQETKKTLNERPSALKPRIFNSHLIVCLGALLNLASSLGSTLNSLWRIIWIALQWVDYFLNGPDDYSGYNNQNDVIKIGHPTLSSQDLTELKTMKKNGYDSILQYQEETILEILEEIKILMIDNGNPLHSFDLQPCPFNKGFYVKLISKISQVEFLQFPFYKSEARKFVSSLCVKTCTDKRIAQPYRLLLANTYVQCFLVMTKRGFKAQKDEAYLAESFLKDLKSFLDGLFVLGRPKEHLAMNFQAEIHLVIFSTLHEHINEYDSFYENFWDLVFEILNTVFVKTDLNHEQDHKLEDKLRQLISTSFSTLQMILDEFLTALPSEHFKPLIDTLLNFCQQKFDINISFSSVSYFWLISDCINTKIGENHVSPPVFYEVHALEELLSEEVSQTPMYYEMLNTYLLARLAQLATDYRSQVREGAIQTSFQILEVQGKKLNSWTSILHIVLPRLLDWNNLRPDASAAMQKDIMVSLNLVLSNMVSIYSTFMMDFEREPAITEQFWSRLLTFLSSLLTLRWCELSLKVFETYLDLLIPFSNAENVPVQMYSQLYNFWINAPIEYDFVNLAYQDSLVAYLGGFKKLLPLIESWSDEFSIAKIMSNLNKCARYPILKPNQKDDQKPTELQRAALDGLSMIGDVFNSEDIAANLAQQLAHICAYPYETRSRIEAKLSSKFGGRIKIPSFIAISQLAFDLLQLKLPELRSFETLFADNRLQKILKSLLFMVHNLAKGTGRDHTEPLWVKCNAMILTLLHRSTDECLPLMADQKSLWELVVESVTVNFEARDESDEKYSIQQYSSLSKRIIPALLESNNVDEVHLLMKTLYTQSFLYESTAVEKDLMGRASPFIEFCDFDFEASFGTTKPIVIHKNRTVRLMCLQELFRFATSKTLPDDSATLDLLTRFAFALRRFIADNRLLRLKPISQIQQTEILVILKGLIDLLAMLDHTQKEKLRHLTSRCIPFCSRVEGLSILLEKLDLN